jgi:hypothetical protein
LHQEGIALGQVCYDIRFQHFYRVLVVHMALRVRLELHHSGNRRTNRRNQ